MPDIRKIKAKHWAVVGLSAGIVLNGAIAAWLLSGDEPGLWIIGGFNLLCGGFCAVVLGKTVAEWRWL